MKAIIFSLLLISGYLQTQSDDICKYDSILEFKEDEKIEYKRTSQLSYYNQRSRYAIRRDYGEIDVIFSSVYGLSNKNFESYKNRERLQSTFDKKDYIIRIQFKLPEGKKLEVKNYQIGGTSTDSLSCVVRLYHLDKTKKGTKIISRKYNITKGSINIEKIKAASFCGVLDVEVPRYYNLHSEFSVKVVTKD